MLLPFWIIKFKTKLQTDRLVLLDQLVTPICPCQSVSDRHASTESFVITDNFLYNDSATMPLENHGKASMAVITNSASSLSLLCPFARLSRNCFAASSLHPPSDQNKTFEINWYDVPL